MNKKRNPQDKAKIVMEFINTSISAAELCRKHNISPTTFQDWKDKFLQRGRQALLNKGDKTKNHAKEVPVCACEWDQMFVYDRHVAYLLLKTGSLPDRTLNVRLHRVSILLESIAPIPPPPNNH